MSKFYLFGWVIFIYIFTKFLPWTDLRTRKIPLKFGGHRSKVKVTEKSQIKTTKRIFIKFLPWIDLRTRKILEKFGGHRSEVKVTEKSENQNYQVDLH